MTRCAPSAHPSAVGVSGEQLLRARRGKPQASDGARVDRERRAGRGCDRGGDGYRAVGQGVGTRGSSQKPLSYPWRGSYSGTFFNDFCTCVGETPKNTDANGTKTALAPVIAATRDRLSVNCLGYRLASMDCRTWGGELPTEAQLESAAGDLRSLQYLWGQDDATCTDAVSGRTPPTLLPTSPRLCLPVGTPAPRVGSPWLLPWPSTRTVRSKGAPETGSSCPQARSWTWPAVSRSSHAIAGIPRTRPLAWAGQCSPSRSRRCLAASPLQPTATSSNDQGRQYWPGASRRRRPRPYSHVVRRGERKRCAHEAESTHVARFEPVRGGPSESRRVFGGEGRGFFRDSRGEAFLPTATTLSRKALFMMATAGGSQRPVRPAKEVAVGGNARLAQQTKETHERVEPQS